MELRLAAIQLLLGQPGRHEEPSDKIDFAFCYALGDISDRVC